MKIAFFLGEFPAISQTFILDQVIGLIERGHEVDIFANEARDTDTLHPEIEKYDLLKRTYYWPKIPRNYFLRLLKGLKLTALHTFKNPSLVLNSLNIFKFGKNATSLRLLYLCIPFLSRPNSYDIIQCHFGWSGLQGMYVRDIGAISGKLVTTFHGFDITKSICDFGEGTYSLLFSKGDLFCPISNYWKQRLIKLGCSEHKIHVHRMGVNLEKFSTSVSQTKLKEKLLLVSIARLVEKKGLEYSIRAVAKVLENLGDVSIEYNIIGDGELKSQLQQLILNLNASDSIFLRGQKRSDEVVHILNHSHVLIAPSVTSEDGDMEGIPVVLMEAMAMGLPVVSTYHSGIPELVNDGVSGFLVPERDVDALADKISYFIKQPEKLEKIGKEGRLKVEREYSLEQLNNQLEKIYQDLLSFPESSKVY